MADHIKLYIPDTRVVVRQPSVIVDRSKLPIQSVAEFALTSSYAQYAKTVDTVNIGVVGSISASGNITASDIYAANSLVVSGITQITGSLNVSGTLNADQLSGSFYGDGVGLINVQNAETASYALTSGLPTGVVSASSQVSYLELSNIPTEIVSASSQIIYYDISNIPDGIVSSSVQINSGSFTGSLVGVATSASTAESASFAVTASYVSGAASDWSTLANKPVGIVSSSIQATTWAVATASYTEYMGIANKPTLVSQSAQIDVRNTIGIETLVTTGSNTFTGVQIISDTTNVTNNVSGALLVAGGVGIGKDLFVSGNMTVVGLLIGTSSWASNAITASAATSITFTPATSSFATTASYALNISELPQGVISSSIQVVQSLPTGTVSASTQINTGSFSGSFVGSGIGLFNVQTSSFAITASYALNAAGGGSVSASWASQSISSSYSETSSYSVTASYLLGGTGPSLIFDGGTPFTSFVGGPTFDLGGVT